MSNKHRRSFFSVIKNIWKYIILLPLKLVDSLVEKLANSVRSSLSFRIAIAHSVLTVLMVGGFSLFIYFGLLSLFPPDSAGILHISKKSLLKSAYYVMGASVFIGMIMLSIGKTISDKLLSPIAKMADEIEIITAENLSSRLDEKGAKDELKELASKFNIMINDIEKSYKRKVEFVSDASHELRTPISVVSGYANMLKRWGKNEPEILDEAIDALISESNQMAALVEKLLFLARSDKGTLEAEKERVDIEEVLDDIYKDYKIMGFARTFKMETFGKKFNVIGDREMLKQLFRIFADNAIKFSEDGGSVSFKAVSDDKNSLKVMIIDDGIGISREDLPKIFDRFYRADKSRNSKRGGNGLGLSIAKLIILAHGASVHIDSEPGVGTKITLQFELEKAA